MLTNFVYMLPMILGRTFDARDDRVGVDIFPQSELNRNQTTPQYLMSTVSKIADSSETIRDMLKISGDLSLKVKAGKVNLKGSGTYLKDASKLERVVEILTQIQYKTITISLPQDPKPLKDWIQLGPENLGTHYIDGVTYGGELVASLKFRANKETDFNSVNAIVKGIFTGTSTDSIVGEGKLEDVKSKLQDKATMEISFYANVPLKGVPQTIEGLRSLVKGFKSHVAEVNNGMGVPIRVQLAEISNLSGKMRFLKNRELEAELSDFEMQFDDVRSTHIKLKNWYRFLPVSIDVQQENKISNLYQRLDSILREFYSVVGDMNIEKGGEQLQPAKIAYEEKKPSPPGKFGRELRRLMAEIVIHEKRVHATGTSTYTRWGSKACPMTSPMTSLLYVGYAAISSNRGIGGGSEYLCLPDNPENDHISTSVWSATSSLVSGVRYGLMDENVFGFNVQSNFGHGVPCARCHVTNRTIVYSFPAADECPTDWLTEYSGVLVSSSNVHGTHMCLVEDPESYSKETSESNSHNLGTVHVDKENFPLLEYVKREVIKCIVCSR